MRNWCYTQRSGLSRPLARSGGSFPFDYGPFGKSRKGKISGLQGATFELKSFRQECGQGSRVSTMRAATSLPSSLSTPVPPLVEAPRR